jgi:hypothetical protein
MADVPLMTNPMTAVADMIIGGASGAPTRLKNNLSASVAPAVTDDSGDGYAIGSRWIDTTADKEYVALDVSVGAAVWTETTQSGTSTFVGAKAYHSTTQNVNNTVAALLMNSEEWDTDAFHDTGSATSRMTIPAGKGGKYLVTAGTFCSGIADWLVLRVDGTTYVRGGSQNLHAAGRWHVSAIVSLTAGQYIEAVVSTTSSIDFGHASALDAQTAVSLYRIAP